MCANNRALCRHLKIVGCALGEGRARKRPISSNSSRIFAPTVAQEKGRHLSMKGSPGEIIETVLELKGGEVDFFALHGGQPLAAGCCEGKVHLPLVLLAAGAAHKAQSLH